jgi:hypothetical protein
MPTGAPIQHPKAKELERARAAKALKVATLDKELRKHEDNIMHLGNHITAKSASLKKQNAHTKACRVATARLKQHHQYTAIDEKKAPADRAFDVRIYTKMDLDVWKYPEMRDWFNKDATKEDLSYKLRPADTGYTIRLDADYKEDTHANFSRGNTPRQPPYSKSSLPNNLIAMDPW